MKFQIKPTADGAAAPSFPTPPASTQDAVASAVAEFGAAVLPKLNGPGQPEDQMRAPLENFLKRVAKHLGIQVNPVGESSLSELRVRADYAIEVDGALVGYIEVKAPGKGADPAKWPAKSHDRKQWEKLSLLPNVLYTDGDEWSLFRKGQTIGSTIRLNGSVKSAGVNLAVDGPGLAAILESFLRWQPTAPRSIGQLVNSVAGLCRLLRDEVVESIQKEKIHGGPFTRLAADWRELLFPEADDHEFADGYAQTVTFGLLLARVDRIDFNGRSIGDIARQLGKGHSLMGKALDVLTDESIGALTRTIDTLIRVVGAVDWSRFEGRKRDPYLHLYETFLEVYDPELRKQTGSYYTPVEVVENMIRLVDGLLKNRLSEPLGFASDRVVVVDPAMGTGTYLLNMIEQASEVIAAEEGPGAVPARLRKMSNRIVGFERQAGPYAVAEMRAYEALRRHNAEPPIDGLRLYVADTLDNPEAEHAHIYAGLEPIARSRRAANKVKRDEPVLVVIGNPPYRDKAKGQGGWIETGNPQIGQLPPLNRFRAAGNGKYEYVLSNMYVYFWRWATWKVFDNHPNEPAGVIAYICPSGFTTGPGFAGMREYLRRSADEGWVIDLSPEGHQAEVGTRVFPGVQPPLCIAIFARYSAGDSNAPARIHYMKVEGTRRAKFSQLASLQMEDTGWQDCGADWQEPFAPASKESWVSNPRLADLMPWVSPGVKTERSWVIAPDAESLRDRWRLLIAESDEGKKNDLLKTSRNRTVFSQPEYLPGTGDRRARMKPLKDEPATAAAPSCRRYGFRSFDRQFLLADHRLMYPARPDLWAADSTRQIYLAEQHAQPIECGPATTFTSLLPDMHFFNGRGGRVLPLYRDAAADVPNIAPNFLSYLTSKFGVAVTPEDFLAYVAAVTSHPGFTRKFLNELTVPGVRVPLTASPVLFHAAVEIGREVLWIHTYGERFGDPNAGRPNSVPRLTLEERPKVIVAIPDDVENMPNSMSYNVADRKLLVGQGQIGPVAPGVWAYETSGMNILRKWFGYRKKERAGRSSSELDAVRPPYWLPEFTTELLDLCNVLGRLVQLEPAQDELLAGILGERLVDVAELERNRVLPVSEDLRSPALMEVGKASAQLPAF
ncbi:type ISP restriction/modification enzyme [Micromonospora matsumotoense]|uniref:type ISP restriction/modification enzyme n=1 Tax=Micromonospora matsumotoense TaxID=121616 RepID=UPI0033F91AEB